jgi:hypothetical protein
VTGKPRTTTRPRGFVLNWRPQAKTKVRLAQVRQVLRTYVSYLPLTIRQVFYVLVGVHDYPKTERDYKNLCEMLAIARRARAIDMAHIRDDDAPTPGFIGFESAAEFIQVVREQAGNLHLDRQARTRPNPYIAVLCEAKGMVPQLARVAGEFSVPVLGSGGFDSITYKGDFARWAASLRRPVEVLHIGDHDPSGVHLYTSFVEDVRAFAAEYCGEVSFSRLVVTPEQAIAWKLPTKPKKETDRRSFRGIGDDPDATVQAEAVPPDVLTDVLRTALSRRFPDDVLYSAELEELRTRRLLTTGFDRLLLPGPGARP